MVEKAAYNRIVLFVIFISSFIYCSKLHSQEMLGIVNSNYSGSAGMAINPSNLVNSRLFFDLNLATVDIFAENNFLYIHKDDYGIFKIFGPNGTPPAYGENDIQFDRRRNDNLRNFYVNLKIQGPSFMIAGHDQAVGFHMAFRSVTSVRGLPNEVGNFLYEGLDYKPQHNIRYTDHDFKMANLDWLELGLTYSRVVYAYGLNRYSAGLSVKYLMGIAGGYTEINELDYMVLNDSTMDIRNLDAVYGYSLPIDYEGRKISSDPLFKGRGIGFDLGFTYMKTKKGAQRKRYNSLCRQEFPDYYYRFGLSLIDIGKINFKENAREYTFDNVSTFWEELDTLKFSDLNQIAGILSERFYDDPDASLSSEKIGVVLPSAVSAQFDYQYLPNLFVNATAVVPLRLGKYYVRRASQISLTPRYEHRWYELSIPLSLYEMRYPRIGLSFRLAFLTIGTEKLGSYFALSDFEGMDFYCSVKINFNRGFCNFFNRRSKSCYNQEYGR